MSENEEIVVSPELSQEFRSFQEFCTENSGQELLYFDVVQKDPLQMDPVTLAFTMRHLVRLSRPLMDMLLRTLDGEDTGPDLSVILATKGIQLDKTHAAALREIVFSFRDAGSGEPQASLIRALQFMAITRNLSSVVLSMDESYQPPEEGWTSEDFGDDDSLYETVRSIENPYWIKTEET